MEHLPSCTGDLVAKRPLERPTPTPSRLGRGLGSLIPVPAQRPAIPPSPLIEPSASVAKVVEVRVATPLRDSTPVPTQSAEELAAPDTSASITFVPLGRLRAGRYQPRGQLDPAGIAALAASIATSGLMQPLVVRPIIGERGTYEVIAGERRWRALEQLGKTEAPVIVRAVGDQEAAELSLVENLQREDLNPMDRAAALHRLVEEFELTHQDLAARIGLDRVTITNLIRLNDLDASTAGLVRAGKLSAGHAKVLLGVQDVVRRSALAERSAVGGWSVRALEQEMQREGHVPRGTSSKSKSRSTGSQSAYVARLERDLQEHLGTRVSVRLTRKKGVGELRIQFFSLDEFDGLMQRIGFQGGDTHMKV